MTAEKPQRKLSKSERAAALAIAVRAAAEEQWPRCPSLRNRCLITSYAFYSAAKRLKISCDLVGGWYLRNPIVVPNKLIFGCKRMIALKSYSPERVRHSWVQSGGEILDCTRTQFGEFPKVAILRIPNPHYICDHIELDESNAWSILADCGRDGQREAVAISARALKGFGA
jgi:hypothetical protein